MHVQKWMPPRQLGENRLPCGLRTTGHASRLTAHASAN
jgi:hypothetical protein